MKGYITRVQPAASPRQWLFSGVGGAVAIALTGALTVYTGTPLLMAAFGASCVLLFSVPASPLSQPVNVVGGHALATAVALVLRSVLPDVWWAVALAVGLAIALMAAFRVTHPPAGADPLVVFAADPDIGFLVFPVVLGAVVLVTTAAVYHRLTGTAYPLRER
jgi:CBS-domain-containing membrane protein